MALVDDIRAACAGVAGRARHVRIVEEAIEPYARTLPAESPPAPDLEGASLEQRAAFSLTLNAINFGSGWFPTLRKPPGLSGYRTVEAGLRARGPWTAAELAAIETPEVAATFGQDPQHELMALFTQALRELGDRVTVEYFGRFLGLVRSAEGSAERLAETLARWPTWHDVSGHDGERVPFFKRAQIAAADLHVAGIAPASDLGRLTLFADNLVPHVLRLDGVLEFDDAPRGADRRRACCSSTARRRRSRSAPARCTRWSCSSRPTGTRRRRRSTTRCGTGARCRATRRGRGIGLGRRLIEAGAGRRGEGSAAVRRRRTVRSTGGSPQCAVRSAPGTPQPQNTAPPPSAASTAIEPPCASATCRTIARPSPEPWRPRAPSPR